MNASLISYVFHRKNLAKSSAGSSFVLLGGKGFCDVLPISLLTRWKIFSMSFLQSKTPLLIDGFLK